MNLRVAAACALAITASLAAGCDVPLTPAEACPAEQPRAFASYGDDGSDGGDANTVYVMLVGPYKPYSTVRVFDVLQPEDVTGGALLSQEGERYILAAILPREGATELVLRTVQRCAPGGTDPTDGSKYPHLAVHVPLPTTHAPSDAIEVTLVDENAPQP